MYTEQECEQIGMNWKGKMLFQSNNTVKSKIRSSLEYCVVKSRWELLAVAEESSKFPLQRKKYPQEVIKRAYKTSCLSVLSSPQVRHRTRQLVSGRAEGEEKRKAGRLLNAGYGHGTEKLCQASGFETRMEPRSG